ncbi:MAG: hypothetical protein U9Q61_07185 [Thermodesulfobacteriota bacterium]|nr:hypothetical protein [Thermodesulfobacteriota bacterium]
MEILDRLESAIEILLEQNSRLKVNNDTLHTEKIKWQEERNHLLEEIDRILKRLDNVQLEES